MPAQKNTLSYCFNDEGKIFSDISAKRNKIASCADTCNLKLLLHTSVITIGLTDVYLDVYQGSHPYQIILSVVEFVLLYPG